MSGEPYLGARVALKAASRARWLARRRRGITGTDVAVVLGLSHWRTPLEVWLDKTQGSTDTPPDYLKARGRRLEPLLGEQYAQRTGARVEKPPLLLSHADDPRMLCSLDFAAWPADGSAAHPLECKTARDWRDWRDGTMPDTYAVQALWQAWVTGCDRVVIFADVAGSLQTREVPRDREWEATAGAAVLEWWDRHVVGGAIPPLDPLYDYDYAHLNRVWEPAPGQTVEADAALLGAVQAHWTLTGRIATLNKLATELKTRARAGMKHATVLTHNGTTIATIDRAGRWHNKYQPPTLAEEPTE